MRAMTTRSCNWTLLGIICCLLGLLGCSSEDTQETSPPGQTSYYFEMDAAKQAKFRDAFQQVRLGDYYDRVFDALGKPDYDGVMGTKDGRFIARSLLYYIKRWNKDSVTEGKDQYVDVLLDVNNHVTRIISNVEGIPSAP